MIEGQGYFPEKILTISRLLFVIILSLCTDTGSALLFQLFLSIIIEKYSYSDVTVQLFVELLQAVPIFKVACSEMGAAFSLFYLFSQEQSASDWSWLNCYHCLFLLNYKLFSKFLDNKQILTAFPFCIIRHFITNLFSTFHAK